ncbi:hypothetical protein BDV06DRAFT_135935 [Aspergillus oleicola]
MSGSSSDQLPPCRFNFWIDVRDLAQVHVAALLKPEADGKRYLPISREPFTYQAASEIIQNVIPEFKGKTPTGEQTVKTHVGVDFGGMERDFPGLQYTLSEKTVAEVGRQFTGFL